MLIAHNFLRNVSSEISWEGPLFTDCRNSCRVWNLFSSMRRETSFSSLLVKVFFEPQIWGSASRPPGLHHSFQTCWTVRFHTGTKRTTCPSTVWALACTNIITALYHCNTSLYLSPLNALFPYFKTIYPPHVTVMITEQQFKPCLLCDTSATPYVYKETVVLPLKRE